MSCEVGGGSGSGPLHWGLTIILIFLNYLVQGTTLYNLNRLQLKFGHVALIARVYQLGSIVKLSYPLIPL